MWSGRTWVGRISDLEGVGGMKMGSGKSGQDEDGVWEEWMVVWKE